MAPLIALIATFGILFVVNRFALNSSLSLSLTGRIALAVMLVMTGVTHFVNTDLMVQMMPNFMPAKRELIYFTGVCELLAAIGLIWDKSAKLSSIMLIVFFLAILPANVIGSLKQVKLGGMENGAIYLLFRIPLQILFIAWTYYFGIRINRTT